MLNKRNWRSGGAIGAFCCLLTLAARPALADITPIGVNDFGPNVPVITFETGTTELPFVPGATFLSEGSPDEQHFDGTGTFAGFFEEQGWGNTSSVVYSDLGLAFSPAVEAVGGYLGRIPNFANEHPPFIDIELFDANAQSLGSAVLTLPAAFDSPVFFGYTADAPIARLELRGNDSGFFGGDNIMFGSMVPEPGAPLLIMLAGAAAVLRRRRA